MPEHDQAAALRTTNVQAVIFDLDGTLLDGSRWQEVIIRTCGQIAAAQPGLDASRLFEANIDVWEHYFPEVEDKWALGVLDGRAVTLEAWTRTLFACGSDDESWARSAAETYLRNRREALRLFDDVRELFSVLGPRLPLALVTNGASDTQREVLRVLGLEHEFAAVVISGEVGIRKPDARVFGIALDKLGIDREHVWHAGDSLRVDVAGARDAGLAAVWLNRGGVHRGEGDPNPDYEIQSLMELPALLSSSVISRQ